MFFTSAVIMSVQLPVLTTAVRWAKGPQTPGWNFIIKPCYEEDDQKT